MKCVFQFHSFSKFGDNVPIHDHITPHYINLHLLKFPDIVKLHTFLFLYDHIHDKKSSKFSFSFISEQHNYATHSASTELLQIPSFRINIRKFCPSIIGRYFWNDIPPNIRTKPYNKLFKKALLNSTFPNIKFDFV